MSQSPKAPRARRTKEERIADMEAEAAQLKRKLRMETVAGVKEAVYLSRALTKWQAEYGEIVIDENNSIESAIAVLESCAEEPQ